VLHRPVESAKFCKASTKLEQFKAINTFLGNLKRSLSGTYHAFDFAKYAHCYPALQCRSRDATQTVQQ
jgi:hypothetical protein